MNLPSTITPEVAAWIRVQTNLAAANAAASVRADLDRHEEWTNGLFVVLINVLPFLLRQHPDLAQQLESQWRGAAERFEQFDVTEERNAEGETAELLEARKMLYRMLTLLQVWPQQKAPREARGRGARGQ